MKDNGVRLCPACGTTVHEGDYERVNCSSVPTAELDGLRERVSDIAMQYKRDEISAEHAMCLIAARLTLTPAAAPAPEPCECGGDWDGPHKAGCPNCPCKDCRDYLAAHPDPTAAAPSNTAQQPPIDFATRTAQTAATPGKLWRCTKCGDYIEGHDKYKGIWHWSGPERAEDGGFWCGPVEEEAR